MHKKMTFGLLFVCSFLAPHVPLYSKKPTLYALIAGDTFPATCNDPETIQGGEN